ncbi:MAG: putative 7-carboxy-7-deazaguanine synthase QueE [Clostridia bacterium]|nr:putative 7-carboxy-7-deazaguanine synthase QueE [Clostridia bacterium]
MARFAVAEKFVSINGEGAKAGELAVFLRFCKCNLNCGYCDTRWANSEAVKAEYMTAEELLKYVKATGVKNVTLTGGEPLLQGDIARLLTLLVEEGADVEIETNGSMPVRALKELLPALSFTVDYKLPSSGMESHMLVENFAYLSSCDTVKFVAGDRADLIRAEEVIKKFGLVEKCRVYLSPVFGQIDPEKIVEFMKEKKLNGVRLQLQLHKFIWKPDERGV